MLSVASANRQSLDRSRTVTAPDTHPRGDIAIVDTRARPSRARVPIAGATPPAAERPSRAAAIACAVVAALCAIVAVTYRLFDPDLWQHLRVGSAIWSLHAVPTRQLWSWPTYGAADIDPSWGFEAVLWPVWAAGGATALAVWRWATTLAAFGLALATARRMGARGVAPFLLAVIAVLVYRQRSQVRPETLVAVLLSLEIWILETRRQKRRIPAALLLAVLWAWVNVHISYPIGFLVLVAYALADTLTPGSGDLPWPRPSPLWLLLVGSVALGMINPFGWRVLWEPFRYLLFERGEAFFRTIGELRPVVWSVNWRNGLPLIVLGWPLLALSRLRQRRPDPVEWILGPVFLALALTGVRFVGFLALVALPFMARDLSEWLGGRRTARPIPIGIRAALVSAACVAITAAEVLGSVYEPGTGFDWRTYPVRACDFIAAHDVRGRLYNALHHGGYLLYRFWPDRGRLPFMDVHASGTPEIRRMAVDAERDPVAWRAFDEKLRFEIALLARPALPGDRTADFLDADTSWALVFLDDAAALYLKRSGAWAPVAERFGYRFVPAGGEKMAALGSAMSRDPALREVVRGELERQIGASAWNGTAHKLLASLDLGEGRLAEARDHLRAAVPLLQREPELRRTLATLERRLTRTR